MKEPRKKMELRLYPLQYENRWLSMIDRESLLFQWCTGKSISHLAREYSLPYHIVYRLIRSD